MRTVNCVCIRTVGTWGYEGDRGDLVPFLDDEERDNSACVDGIMFLGG